jgi:CDP-diacylglycerol--serine O-phosphatidyltransferase
MVYMLKNLKAKDYTTLLGTLSGLIAVVLALPPFNAYRAAIFVLFLGVFLDLLDGYVARKMGEFNAFGVQLDSLNDAFVFGVAPAIIAYLIYTKPTTDMGLSGIPLIVMIIASFILIAGGIVRLAWFNLSENSSEYVGVPIPTTASVLGLLMLADYFTFVIANRPLASGSSVPTWFNIAMQWVIPLSMVALAWMNTTSHLVFGKVFRKKSGYVRYIFITIAILLLVMLVLMIFWREEAAVAILILILFYLGLFTWFITVGVRTAREKALAEKN